MLGIDEVGTTCSIKRRYWRGLSVSLLICAACSDGGSAAGVDPPDYSRRDSAEIVIHSNGAAESVESFQLGKVLLEAGADEEAPLAWVAGAVPLANGIAIAENGSSSILVVDTLAARVEFVGGAGAGPGEFEQLGGIWLSENGAIVVFDRQLQRLTLYRPSGELVAVRAMRPASANPPIPIGLLADNVLVVSERRFDIPQSGFEPLEISVRTFGSSGVTTIFDTITGRMGRVHGRRGGFVSSPHFEAAVKVAAAGNSVWVSTCTRPELMVLDNSGHIEGLVRWAMGDRPVGADHLEQLRRDRLAGTADRERQEAAERFDAIPAAEFLPVCDRLLANRDGSVSVRIYRPPTAGDHQWLTFDRGELTRTVASPSGTEILWLGPEHAISLETDDLGIEYVRLRGIVASQ